jgi:hypothetical protein
VAPLGLDDIEVLSCFLASQREEGGQTEIPAARAVDLYLSFKIAVGTFGKLDNFRNLDSLETLKT